MNKLQFFGFFNFFLFSIITSGLGCTQPSEVKNEIDTTLTSISHLQKNGNAIQLMVDNEPFIMISGELHNSSSSSVEYLSPLWTKLKAMNLNSVIASISWEQFEPEEGVYDYTLVDAIIEKAKENKLKLSLIWFASWKNGQSSYVPLWVKKDTKRFFRVKTKKGEIIETISPFCDNAMKADAKAFSMLMKHIKKVDKDNTVIMMQPENEVGIFQDIDYNSQALHKFEQEVPAQLCSYLEQNTNQLEKEVKSVWQLNGYKTKGTWKEVFGNSEYAKEFFMVWQYATYINEVVKAGKKEHPIPMFVNAWIVQKPDDLPGIYPNGGPVSRVMDIYKAAAKDIDVLCPDIYLPNFKEIATMYHRYDNPLLIPESTLDAGKAFYAFAEHDAICFSPFGIEDGVNNFSFTQSCKTLNELMPLITKYQGTGKMFGILAEGDEKERTIELGDYLIKIVYEKLKGESYGLIIQTAENEFLVSGMNMQVYFSANNPNKIGNIGQIWEGGYEDGKWKSTRLLNGDETSHNWVLKVNGRQFVTTEARNSMEPEQKIFTYSSNKNKIISTPGVYKVITYLRE